MIEMHREYLFSSLLLRLLTAVLTRLRPNQVITIEPGLYIPPTEKYPKWAHNIGVRIEDEVLIREGDQEPVVLSVSAPKEVSPPYLCFKSVREIFIRTVRDPWILQFIIPCLILLCCILLTVLTFRLSMWKARARDF